MKTEFQKGAKVRFDIPNGALAVIQKYLGEGFYAIKTIPDERELVALETDLILGWNQKAGKKERD